MRRRLDLAASLISRPPLIFLDEPTTGLDPRTRGQMWDTIRELVADGCTVLLDDAVPRRGRPARRPGRGHRPRPQGRPGHARRAQGQVGNSTLQLRMLDAAHTAAAADVVRRVLGEEPVLTPEAGGINVALTDANLRRRRADRPAPARPVDQLGDRAEAHPRRGVHGPHRSRRRGPPARARDGARTMTTTLTPAPDETVTAVTHAGVLDLPARPTLRDTVSQSLAMAWRATKKMRRNPEQWFDVTHPAAAVHRDVRLHLRWRDLRQRRRLPADPHPRHPGPDRADRVHGHRHPAARGHGQGRLRPLQVAADRADRTPGRPGARRPAALRHRGDAHHLHRHPDGLPPRRRRRSACSVGG